MDVKNPLGSLPPVSEMSVVKIKEFKAKNEEELLDLVTLWPKFDEE